MKGAKDSITPNSLKNVGSFPTTSSLVNAVLNASGLEEGYWHANTWSDISFVSEYIQSGAWGGLEEGYIDDLGLGTSGSLTRKDGIIRNDKGDMYQEGLTEELLAYVEKFKDMFPDMDELSILQMLTVGMGVTALATFFNPYLGLSAGIHVGVLLASELYNTFFVKENGEWVEQGEYIHFTLDENGNWQSELQSELNKEFAKEVDSSFLSEVEKNFDAIMEEIGASDNLLNEKMKHDLVSIIDDSIDEDNKLSNKELQKNIDEYLEDETKSDYEKEIVKEITKGLDPLEPLEPIFSDDPSENEKKSKEQLDREAKKEKESQDKGNPPTGGGGDGDKNKVDPVTPPPVPSEPTEPKEPINVDLGGIIGAINGIGKTIDNQTGELSKQTSEVKKQTKVIEDTYKNTYDNITLKEGSKARAEKDLTDNKNKVEYSQKEVERHLDSEGNEYVIFEGYKLNIRASKVAEKNIEQHLDLRTTNEANVHQEQTYETEQQKIDAKKDIENTGVEDFKVPPELDDYQVHRQIGEDFFSSEETKAPDVPIE